jgi:hypothetical protein
MKVYVVQTDNGMEYEDYEDKIENIFKSYRSASQHLLDMGFRPYSEKNYLNKWQLYFEKPRLEFDAKIMRSGWISEFELQD